jgi:hypothetical protein
MADNSATAAPAKMRYFKGIIHRNAQHGTAWFFADDSVNKKLQIACEVEVIIPAYVVENIKGTIVDRVIVKPVPGKKRGFKNIRERFNRYTWEQLGEVTPEEWAKFEAEQREMPIPDGDSEE